MVILFQDLCIHNSFEVPKRQGNVSAYIVLSAYKEAIAFLLSYPDDPTMLV